MNKEVVFTVTRYHSNGCALVKIETKNKNFAQYNADKISELRVFDRMENISISLNAKNCAVLFEIG